MICVNYNHENKSMSFGSWVNGVEGYSYTGGRSDRLLLPGLKNHCGS